MARTGNFSKQLANKKRDVAKDLKSIEYNGAVEAKDDYLAELTMLANLGKNKTDSNSVETPKEESVNMQTQIQEETSKTAYKPENEETKKSDVHTPVDTQADESIQNKEIVSVEPVAVEAQTVSKPKTQKKDSTSKPVTKKDTTVKPAEDKPASKQEKTSSSNDSVKANAAQLEDSTPVDEPVISMERKLPTEKSTHCQRNNCCTWNCTVKPECESKFVYEAAVQGTTMMELINRIVYAEMEWQKQHPEFPSKEFVLSNIKNRKAIKHNRQEHVSMSLIFSPGAWDFVKIASKRCGMHMNVFLEFLIDEYCVS